LHEMFEVMPYAVASAGKDLRVISLNGRMRSYLSEIGVAGEIEGRSLATAFPFMGSALETISLEMVEHCAPECREESFTDPRGDDVGIQLVSVPPARGDLRLLLIIPLQESKSASSRMELRDETSSREPDASGSDSKVQGAEAQQEELSVRASRLDSIELLAGGIAHDFNNLLTLILGSVSLAGALIQGNGKVEKILSNAEKAVMRAEELTRQLSSFARGGAPEICPTDLKELIEESVDFSLLGSRIKCESNLPDDLWAVSADKGQIGQVIGNLVINARQAMTDGGSLKVSSSNIRISGQEEPSLKEGRYVKTEVADSGHGISADIQEKIFDPYFTTKNCGSGLGLATVFSIIRRHRGIVKVDSRQGEGSVFSFYLPAAVVEKQKTVILPEKDGNSLQGRILVMDDEQEVSKICSIMLEKVGHEVVVCDNGATAVEIYKAALEQGARFDLVILDLTVPGGMGGMDALDRLRELDPDVKAIVSSGYCCDPVMSDPSAYGFKGVVPKPYDFKLIRKVVADVLQSALRV